MRCRAPAWSDGDEGLRPDRCSDPGRDPRVRRRIIGRPDLHQGGSATLTPRPSGTPCRGTRRSRALRPPRRSGVRHARLRTGPARHADGRRRVAVVLTAFPRSMRASAWPSARHARERDRPAPRPAQRRPASRRHPGRRDELMHRLNRGRRARPRVHHRRAAHRRPAAHLRRRLPRLVRHAPADLRASMEEQWGPAPATANVDPATGDLVVAGIALGDVVVLIQPPRGYGDDQVGIYHDPELAPPATPLPRGLPLAADVLRWQRVDAIVHLGKHGTLEWTPPGKMLALSASCAPLRGARRHPPRLPVRRERPGEGAQAKRRAACRGRRSPRAADDARRELPTTRRPRGR